MVFELLTAEYLFDPQGQGELFSKDDDHMAQIMELLGDFDLEVKLGGRFSRELFDHNGELSYPIYSLFPNCSQRPTGSLRYIRNLKFWPLKRVMMEKYLYSEEEAQSLCSFLDPMLACDFKKRANARDLVNHEWLNVVEGDEVSGSW